MPTPPHPDAFRLLALKHGQELRKLADNPACPAEALLAALNIATKSVQQRSKPREFPAIADAYDLVKNPPREPPCLIESLLHQGEKLAWGGSSKTYKSWGMLDMALSISHEVPWLGLKTTQTKVLFLNLELPKWAVSYRLGTIARKRGIEMVPSQLRVWNLRGFSAGYAQFLPQLEEKISEGNYGLLLLDPIYKIYGHLDENSAGDIAELMNGLEELSVKVNSAISFSAHFSKGNQAAKESLDRISGSGVFARDPDCLLMLTRHEEKNAFVLETTLRNFAPLAPFVVRWEFPVFSRADDLDPQKLQQSGGRTPKHENKELLAAIAHTSAEEPISVSKWSEVAGVPRTTLGGYVKTFRDYAWIDDAAKGKGIFITEAGKVALET